MAKTLANYDPLVQIPSGMTPAGADFPIVESHDILVGENDKRLDAKLDDIDSAIGNVGQTPIATQLSSKVNTGDIVTSVAATGSTSNNKIPSETAVRAAIEAKTINVDSTVTQGSTNAVSGGAVHTQLATKQDALTFDTTPTASSSNPVTSGGVKAALDTKQDALTFDTTPTASSSNPVTSGGVKAALDTKQNTLTYETTPIAGSVNPVTSTGIRNAIDTAAAQNLGAMQAQYTEFVADADAVLGRASSLSNGMVACSNIAAETTVGDTRILLYTGTTNSKYTNGHWYYNSAASNAAPSWTDGGAVGSAPTIDNTLTVEGAAANSKAVGDAIENIVTISNTQPGSNSGNKVWIKETTSEEVQIPTYAEHIAKANKADIATNNESDNGSGTITASKKYAIGDHFYINNTNTSSENYGVSTLYKATAAIASGDAIVVGTNCEASKVADEITSLSNDIDTVKADLDNNVNDLKSALITGDPFTQSDIIRGSFNGQMQPVSNNARLRVERVLNVFRGQHLTFIEGTVIKQMLVGYFTPTGVYIRDSQYYNSGTDLVFDDDYKIIIIFRKDASTTINITDYDATTKLSPLPMSVRNLLSDLAQPLGFYGALRFYKTSVSHSSAFDRLYCDIPSGTEFYIHLKRATNNWIYFYAYDASGNTGGTSIASTNQQEILLKATAPFDIKSIGIADSSDNVGWYEVTAYSVDSAIVTSGQGLEIATNARDSIANLVIDGDAQNLYSESTATVGYLNASGGIGADQVNNRTTDYIPVAENTYITVQTWMELPSGVTQWQAVCFYDANKSLIGSRNVKTGGTDSYAYYTVAIPSTAVYVRASSRAYNNYKIMVQFGDVATAFQIGQDDINTIIKANLNPKSNDLYVKSINHRGWIDAPENTIPAFIESKQHGFNYVETDIALTSDGVAVLLHDNTINRTARNADGTTISGEINISDITYEQALQYDFGIYKGSEYAGTKIPTLKEFLTVCKKLALRPYLELKSGASYTEAQIRSVVDIVKDFNMLKESTFISFSFYYLRPIRDYAPTARLSRITTAPTESWFTDSSEGLLLLKTGENEVFADSSSYGSDIVALCKSHDIPLEIWTINTMSDIATMDGYISGVTSDKLIASTILENDVLS